MHNISISLPNKNVKMIITVSESCLVNEMRSDNQPSSSSPTALPFDKKPPLEYSAGKLHAGLFLSKSGRFRICGHGGWLPEEAVLIPF